MGDLTQSQVKKTNKKKGDLLKKFLFSSLFLATVICSESHALSCYIVKTENGTHRFKYHAEFGRLLSEDGSTVFHGARLKFYDDPGDDYMTLYSRNKECWIQSVGESCEANGRRGTVSITLKIFLKDDGYFVTASVFDPKTPKDYYFKDEPCTVIGDHL